MKRLLFILVLVFGLATAAGAQDIRYQSYRNDHADPAFSIDIPDIFDSLRISGSGDTPASVTLEFEGKGGAYVLMVCEGAELLHSEEFSKIKQVDGPSLLKEKIDRLVGDLIPGTDKSGPAFYALEYTSEGPKEDEEYIAHEYGALNTRTKGLAYYILVYPKSEEARFAAVKSRMDASLKLDAE